MRSTRRLVAFASCFMAPPECEAVRKYAGGMLPDLPSRGVQSYSKSWRALPALWAAPGPPPGRGEAAKAAAEERRTASGPATDRDWVADFFLGEDTPSVLDAPVQLGLDEVDVDGFDALEAESSWIDSDPVLTEDPAVPALAETASGGAQAPDAAGGEGGAEVIQRESDAEKMMQAIRREQWERHIGPAAFGLDKMAAGVLSWKPVRFLMDGARRGHAAARFGADYELSGAVLGSGLSGTIQQARCRRTGRDVAVKTIRTGNLSGLALLSVKREAEVHSAMSHPNIVDLEAVYETQDSYYLVMEQLHGGTLWDRLMESGRFAEKEAAKVAVQLLRALSYMHSQGVMHRDIKFLNIMYSAKGGDEVKLVDFGLATKFEKHKRIKLRGGTVPYYAPEVLNGEGCDEKADLWSLGVVLYILLVAEEPYGKADDDEILRRIRKGAIQWSWVSHLIDSKILSAEARDFLASLLRMDPADRLSAEQALQHAWFRQHAPEEAAAALEECAARSAPGRPRRTGGRRPSPRSVTGAAPLRP